MQLVALSYQSWLMGAIIEPIDFLRKNLIDFDNFHLNFDRVWC